MSILSCAGLKKSFGAFEALKDVTFMIEEGEKAAIAGVNGAGKTTLLRVIAGEDKADDGEISLKKGTRVGYLSQMGVVSPQNTVERELLTVFDGVLKKESEMRNIERLMKHTSGAALDGLMEKYSKYAREFEDADGYAVRSRVKGVLNGLGFSDFDAKREISTMSGGQKTRIALCKLLLTSPELLLLDEPTNHLDIESVEWLEDLFLKNYAGSVLIISHDRYFLDKTVSKIIEIENGKSTVYFGNYSYYSRKKEEDRENLQKRHDDQQKEIKRQEESIKRLYSYGREKRIRAAQSKEKRLAKLERVDAPENLPDKMWLTLEPRKKSGYDVLFVRNLAKSFGDKHLFSGVSFDIKRGENAALIGANGIGKTTLMNMLASEKLPESLVRFGTNVEIGYFDQEYLRLDEEKSIFDEIADEYPYLANIEIRNTLAAFVFLDDDVFKKISTLSGGEKGRVALAKLMLSNANLLLLDEPTNHLDIFSKEVLEEALRNYAGTVLCVSHDRYFINATADKVLELSGDGLTEYLGDYDYYVEKKAFLAEIAAAEEGVENAAPVGASVSKQERERKKAKNAGERSRKAQIEKIEREIDKMEQEVETLDKILHSEAVATDAAACAEYFSKKVEYESILSELYEKWDSLSAEV